MRMRQKQHYIGLTDAQVLENRKKYGINVLTPPKKESVWKKFLEKFTEPLIIVLLVAGFLSIGISCYEYWYVPNTGGEVFFEPVGIFVAIFIATGMSFVFEYKADKEFSILNKVNDDEPVQVYRNGNVTEIPKRDVVVGDIVNIETGCEIPADGKLLDALSLQVDESSLTGEPICNKTVFPDEFNKEATFPSNNVMRGTKVMEGHGVCEIFAVGDNTENGKVYEATQIDDTVKTPLNEQLERLGKLVTNVSYAIGVLVVVGRMFMYFHFNADLHLITTITYCLESLMVAVTLIVVAVPEGLPMAVTLSLAYSMRRMLKTNNLVRKLHACETMGAATVICTDKTGTLTQNKMRVYQTNFYSLKDQMLTDDDISLLIKEALAVNSTASLDMSDRDNMNVVGNPTEGALLLWLYDNGVNYATYREHGEVVEQLPFSTERKYMATVVCSGQQKILYIKGAPEIVYSLCKHTCGNIDENTIHEQLIGYQAQAMRTLGFAYQILKPDDKTFDSEKVVANNITFLGVVAIADRVREDVPAAVKECLDAGIKIKIVTGDTPGTAKEIGKQIGLWTNKDTDYNMITGPQFAALSDEELRDRIMDIKIISRARPMDKKRLVETLQAKDQVVAVTGDGTNDAPALKAAQVGLSMGDGTSVAKEASDITIIDNSFSSITRAVMWGRSLYQNIQRFVLFQLTVNVVACLIVLVGAFSGSQSPLTVTQMLWVNLIMDTFAAMALASLPPAESVMKDKPRDRKAFIINKKMKWNIIGVGGLFFVFLWGLLYIFQHADITCMTDFANLSFTAKHELTPKELSLFFTMFVMLQFWNMFNARAFFTGRSAFYLKGCRGFIFILLIIIIGQIFIVSLGGKMFSVVPLSITDWVIILAATSLVLWIGEVVRLFPNVNTPV
jgi:P-type Ca2+ transporter type 2C